MNLEQLLYLTEVDKYKSITKAANNLFISQSTISMAILNLEKELEMIIFKRSKRGVTTTTNGKKIIDYAQKVLNEIDSMKKFAASFSNNLESTIKITSAPTFCNSILIDIVAELLLEKPEIHLEIKENNNNHIIEDLFSGKIDLGIIGFMYEDKEDILENLHKRSIGYEEFYVANINLYVNENHPLLKKESNFIQDLANYPIITHENLLNNWKGYPEVKNMVSEFYNYESIKKIIQNSNLIGIMPNIVEINDYSINSRKIIQLEQIPLNSKVCFGLVRSLKNVVLPPEKIIIDLLKKKSQNLSYDTEISKKPQNES